MIEPAFSQYYLQYIYNSYLPGEPIKNNIIKRNEFTPEGDYIYVSNKRKTIHINPEEDIPYWNLLSDAEKKINKLNLGGVISQYPEPLLQKFFIAWEFRETLGKDATIKELILFFKTLYQDNLLLLDYLDMILRGLSMVRFESFEINKKVSSIDQITYGLLCFSFLIMAFGVTDMKRKDDKNSVILQGQEIWWLLHVACRHLSNLYYYVISTSIRIKSVCFLNFTPQNFAWDYASKIGDTMQYLLHMQHDENFKHLIQYKNIKAITNEYKHFNNEFLLSITILVCAIQS